MLNNIKHIYGEISSKMMEKDKKILKIGLITVIVLAIVFNITYTLVDNYWTNKINTEQAEQKVWAETEKIITQKADGIAIAFSDINTSGSKVQSLVGATTSMANKINESDQDKDGTPDIPIEAEIIPEEAFITVNESKEGTEKTEVEKDTTALQKSASIYMADTYMAEFMSESGKFETIIAQYTNGEIRVSPRKAFENKIEYSLSDKAKEGEITESDYIADIKYCLVNIYGPGWTEHQSDVREMMFKYFTTDCGNSLIDQIAEYDGTQVESIGIGFIAPGKSSKDIDRVDRIYAQIELNINKQRAYIDLEMKLDSHNKIFDIDVL